MSHFLKKSAIAWSFMGAGAIDPPHAILGWVAYFVLFSLAWILMEVWFVDKSDVRELGKAISNIDQVNS